MTRTVEQIIDRQFHRWEIDRRSAPLGVATAVQLIAQPIITVSRQHGSRGRELAARLAERFQYTLLHRDVIDHISRSTGHTRRLLEAIDEHSRSDATNWVESMLSGKYLDERDYAVGLIKTVYSIARLGGVVVVGRGANFIVGLAGGVHLRVVAPVDERIDNLMQRRSLSLDEAAREIKAVDMERAKLVRKLFHRSSDDALAYDIILNESGAPRGHCSRSVTWEMAKHMRTDRQARPLGPHCQVPHENLQTLEIGSPSRTTADTCLGWDPARRSRRPSPGSTGLLTSCASNSLCRNLTFA